MLTKQDLTAIGKLIDQRLDIKLKDVKTDIAAIQVRLRDIETAQPERIYFLEMRNLLRQIEKRVTALDGRMSITEVRLDTIGLKLDKLELGFTQIRKEMNQKFQITNKKLMSMENRLIKKLNYVIDSFDNEGIKVSRRVDRLEHHLQLPPLSS